MFHITVRAHSMGTAWLDAKLGGVLSFLKT